VCNTTANRTIKIDATTPANTCDYSDYMRLKRTDYVEFTTSDACGISTRKWSRDSGTTVSTSFVDTDDVDINNWQRADYTVNSTVCDAAGNCKHASCSIGIKQTQRRSQYVIEASTPITIEEGQLKATEEKKGLPMPIIFGGIGVVVVLVLVDRMGGKRGKKKRRKRR
jgi:hypothetical protein